MPRSEYDHTSVNRTRTHRARLREENIQRSTLTISESAANALRSLLLAGYAPTQQECMVRALNEFDSKQAPSSSDASAAADSQRNEAIRALIAVHASQAAFAQRVGIAPETLSRSLRNGFSDQTARKIEAALGLRTGEIDGQIGAAPTSCRIDFLASADQAERLRLIMDERSLRTRGEAMSIVILQACATKKTEPARLPSVIAEQRRTELRQLLERYPVQATLAKELGIYPERLTRILQGSSGIGNELALRIKRLSEQVTP